jgi:glycosyltransferase involved in cell wall biosynthesis
MLVISMRLFKVFWDRITHIFEYIVLDVGSTDITWEVLSKYTGRLIWETHSNMGETRTVNKG